MTRIHALDGLRGVLALYVAVYHLGSSFMREGAALQGLSHALGQAWYSVDVFFVMSGLVMAHVYGAAWANGAGRAQIMAFFKARVARLYPVHLLALGLMAVGIVRAFWGTPEMMDADGRYAWSAALMSLFMLHGPWIDHRTWNYPAWSISAEWHAYALFPFMAATLMRWQGLAARLAIMVCVVVPWLIYTQGEQADTYPTNGLLVLARVLPLFAAGVMLKGAMAQDPMVRQILASMRIGPLVLLISLLLLFASPWPALAVLLVPALVAGVMNDAGLSRLFSRGRLVWLGQVSYSLYMTHVLVEMYGVNTLSRWLMRHGVDVTQSVGASLAMLAGAVAMALLLAWATWRWVEVPGRAWVMGLGRTPKLASGQVG